MLIEGAEPCLRRAQPGCSHKGSQKRKCMAPGEGGGMRPHLASRAGDLSVELGMLNEVLFPHRITKDEAKTSSSPGHDHCKCRLALGPHPLAWGLAGLPTRYHIF